MKTSITLATLEMEASAAVALAMVEDDLRLGFSDPVGS